MRKSWENKEISFGKSKKLDFAFEILYKATSTAEEMQHAFTTIEQSVVLQSDLFEAAYFVIEPLLDVLELKWVTNKFYGLDCLYEIFVGCAPADKIVKVDEGDSLHLSIACRKKITSLKSRISKIETFTEQEEKAKQDLLSVIMDPPSLAPTSEEIEEIKRLLKIK